MLRKSLIHDQQRWRVTPSRSLEGTNTWRSTSFPLLTSEVMNRAIENRDPCVQTTRAFGQGHSLAKKDCLVRLASDRRLQRGHLPGGS